MSTYPNPHASQADRNPVSFADLCALCGMSDEELDELMDYGAVESIKPSGQILMFDAECVAPLRTALHMRRDYDLDSFMVVILLDLLKRIANLEEQLESFRQIAATHEFNSKPAA